MADVPWTGRLLPPAPISDEHDLSQFDSGVATINAFLTSNALLNHRERYSLVLVLADEAHRVFGYYALTIGQVSRQIGTKGKARRGAPANIPAVILGRLGVDKSLQGKGVGQDLLMHSIGLTLALSRENKEGLAPPVSVMAIKALNGNVASFYEHMGFQAFDPEHPLELVRSIRDLMGDHKTAMTEARET